MNSGQVRITGRATIPRPAIAACFTPTMSSLSRRGASGITTSPLFSLEWRRRHVGATPICYHEKRQMFADFLERLRRAACIQIRRGCRQKPRRWIALWQMLVTIAAPSILTTSVLNFLFCWNEYLFALVLTSHLLACATAGTAVWPLFALFLIRRHLSTGFGMGAVR